MRRQDLQHYEFWIRPDPGRSIGLVHSSDDQCYRKRKSWPHKLQLRDCQRRLRLLGCRTYAKRDLFRGYVFNNFRELRQVEGTGLGLIGRCADLDETAVRRAALAQLRGGHVGREHVRIAMAFDARLRIGIEPG